MPQRPHSQRRLLAPFLGTSHTCAVFCRELVTRWEATCPPVLRRISACDVYPAREHHERKRCDTPFRRWRGRQQLFAPHASYGDIWDFRQARLFILAIQLSNQHLPTHGLRRDDCYHAANPASLAPVGNPLGASSFTIWQPGLVTLDREHNALEFTTSFMPWSPDGRYFAPSFAVGGRLVHQHPEHQPGERWRVPDSSA